MGQLVTTVAGGIIGGLIGGPMGASIGMTLGGMVGATLFGPTIKGPRLTDLKVTASTYGTAIPEVFGTVRIGGNLIWTTGIKETKHSSRAGKGGPKQENYTYDASFAMGLCTGTIDDVLRIWCDGKLIYDKSANATRDLGTGNIGTWAAAILKAKKKPSIKFRLYKGSDTQLPDSLIEADKGVGNVSAHRGLAYVVFEKLQLEDYGNRIPQLTFEVTKMLTTNFPSITAKLAGDTVPPNIAGKVWIPDWQLGRLVAMDSGSYTPKKTVVYDLATMQAVVESDAIGEGNRMCYIPELALYFRETGTANSRPLSVFNMLTLTKVNEIGKSGGSVGGVYINGAGDRLEQYSALGKINYVRVPLMTGGERLFLLWTGWTGATWAVNYSSTIPLFTATATFGPQGMISGKSDFLGGEIIGWRRSGVTMQFEAWHIGVFALGEEYIDEFGILRWKPTEDWRRAVHTITPFATGTFYPVVVLYDQTDNHIFVAGQLNNKLATFKYSLETDTFKFAKEHATVPPPQHAAEYSRIQGGSFGYGYQSYGQPSKLVQIDLQTGELIQNYGFGSAFGSSLAFGDKQHWDDVSATLLTETAGQYRRIAFRAGASFISVPSVVEAVCLRTGVLGLDDIDTSELDPGNLVGYVIDRECSARDVLKQMGTAFLFDGYESDYKLKFRSRGLSSMVTIPENWIARNKDGQVVGETITQELEMPLKVTINYYDTSRDHQQGSQSAKRRAGPVPTMWTRKEDIIDLPITWTPDDAKQCADKLLKMTWANRTAFKMELPWRYMKYDPTDVGTVVLQNGTVFTMRFSEATIGADFTVDLDAVSEKATAYTSDASGAFGLTDGQTISGVFPCFPIIANTPLLRDTDYNTSGHSTCYLSVGTSAMSFDGASVLINDGIEFRAIGYIGSESVTGYCMSALPKTTAYEATDETSVLYVRLSDPGHTLSSVTQDDMVTLYANAALVGDEIINFRDVEAMSDGRWKLTGLLRARRGTNYAVSGHTVGERFLLLQDTTMVKSIRAPEDYNVIREFKAVPTGSLIEDATSYSANLIPRDLMPYTPENTTISDDATTVTMTTQRRSRVTAPLIDGAGSVHYKEADKASAKITYKIWPGLTLADVNTVTDPTISGNVALFDSAGLDIDPSFTFPLADLGGATTFLIKLYEVGFVDGTPKWIEFKRIGTNRWDYTELY